MKRYILLLLTILSFTAYSQTVPSLPVGAKPFGSPYILPSTKRVILGNAGYGYKYMATDSALALRARKVYVDSALVLKSNVINSFNNIHKDIKSIGSVFNSILTADFDKIINGSATFTFLTGKINFTGGSDDYVNYIEVNKWPTSSNNYTLSTKVVPTANGSGIAIGFNSLYAKINLSAVTNRGQLQIATTGSVTLATSLTNLSYTNGDTILLSLTRRNNIVTFTATNRATNIAVTVSKTWNTSYAEASANRLQAYSPARVYAYGGSQSVTYFDYSLNGGSNTDLLIIGHSIAEGMYAGETNGGYAQIIGKSARYVVDNESRRGLEAAQLISVFAEIKKYNARYVLIDIGANEVVNGTTSNTYINNLKRLRDSLVANGSKPVFKTVLPFGTQVRTDTARVFNTKLYAEFSASYPIINDFNIGIVKGLLGSFYSADGVHPNDILHAKLATKISTSLDSLGIGLVYPNTAADITQGNLLFWDKTNGRLGLSKTDPAYKVDIKDAATVEINMEGMVNGNGIYGILNNTAPNDKNGLVIGMKARLPDSTLTANLSSINFQPIEPLGITSANRGTSIGMSVTQVGTSVRSQRFLLTRAGLGVGTFGYSFQPTAILHTRGDGTTSSTFNFKSENSTATKSITFRDDGLYTFTGASVFDNGSSGDALTVNNNGYINFAGTARLRGFGTAYQFQDASFSTKVNLSLTTAVSYFNSGGAYLFGTTTDGGGGQILQVTGRASVSTQPTATTDVVRLTDLGVVNPTTTALSSATLNSTYPSVIVGFRVICHLITGAPAIYTKATENGSSDVWLTTATTTTP